MAKIGLKYFRYSNLLNPDTQAEANYFGVKIPGKAVTCNVSITNNSAELYADDVLVESDTTFSNGTVTMEVDEDDLETMADLLGHKIENGEIVRKSFDVAPYVGLGRIVVKLVNNVRKYKVEFLYKVKFSEPNQENQTKGENVEFKTTSIEGKVAALKNGKWSVAKTFESETEATNYLEGLMARKNVTLTYDANGGTGTVAPTTVLAGDSTQLNDGSGLTAPAGKSFFGWGTTSTSTTKLESPYTVTQDTTLYAIWVPSVTLTYNVNGGTGSVDPQTVAQGASVTLNNGSGLTAPTNKVFGGWGISSTSTTAVENPYTVTQDTTLYAIWNTQT